MAPQTTFNYKVYIQRIGFLLLVGGFLILLPYLSFFWDRPWIKMGISWQDWIFKEEFVYNLFHSWGLLLFISGFGLLKLKPWARECLLHTIYSYSFGLLMTFPAFGYIGLETIYLTSILVIGPIAWFFHLEPIKTYFPEINKKQVKWIASISLVVGLSFFIAIGKIWYEQEAFKLSPLQDGILTEEQKNYSGINFYRPSLPLKFSIDVPSSATFNFSLSKSFHINLQANEGTLSLEQVTPLQMGTETFSELPPIWVLPFENQYQWGEKILSERFGIVFVLIRSMFFGDLKNHTVKEYKVGDLTVFVEEVDAKKTSEETRRDGEFHIFQGSQPMGGGQIRNADQKLILHLIASIKPKNNQSKTYEDFFQEGLVLFEKQNFEKAKFALASAHYLDRKNPLYPFYLGKAFMQTQGWEFAKYYFDKALSIQPNYPEAKRLLVDATAQTNKNSTINTNE